MGEIIVKHFKRTDPRSDSKELVTEIVVEGSDTGRFLKRIELSRLQRPCFQSIDMRGKVAGECLRYVFNDRVHYLDDISFQMFERGLRENNGVYTVGTFEAIVGGPHTLRAQMSAREAAEQRRQEIEQRRLEREQDARRERAKIAGQDPGEVTTVRVVENPQTLPLGYFRRRKYPRLQYACKVRVSHEGHQIAGVTREISVCGVQVRVKGPPGLREGDDVELDFTGFPDDVGGGAVLQGVRFRLVRMDMLEHESALYLQRDNLDHPAGFSDFVTSFIEENKHRYKLDVEDEYRSVLAWFYERCHAQSLSQLPLYIERAEEGGLQLQAVAMSEGNTHLVRFFCNALDNYDFTPLSLPQRLSRLEREGSFLLAVYRDRSGDEEGTRLYSAADFEFETAQDFMRFVRYAASKPEYSIIKVVRGSRPLIPVAERKFEEVSSRLRYKSKSGVEALREQMDRLEMVAYAVDVSDLFESCRDSETAEEETRAGPEGLAAWLGGQRVSLPDRRVLESLEAAALTPRAELVRFGYVERRREDRYLAETRVEVRIGERLYKGMSRDISTRGIRIHIPKRVQVKAGAPVKVGLVSLQQKKNSTNLMDIPYLVVQARHIDEGTELRLERVLGSARAGLKEFFVELITKNQHKLVVDTTDILGAASSRLYESLLAANTPSVPFFIGRSTEGGAHLQYVGVPEGGNALVDFCDTGEELDLRALNDRRLVTALYDAVQILMRQKNASDQPVAPFALELYLYRETDAETGSQFVHSATELDFPDDVAREAWLKTLATKPSWRCLRLLASDAHRPEEKAIEQLIQGVRQQSKHRAIRLSDLVHALVGCAEVVDITAERARVSGLPWPRQGD
ncbi:MAG TPA: PilZ domain-containing protein [Gammaproteobacteria bacterium]|nr:PilZ domain-containing protein [Gammaproteobacteria bacterium]